PIEDFLRSLKQVGEESLAPVRCDDGWGQEYDLMLRACRTYSFKVKITAEDHGGFKRLFRVRMTLNRKPRLFVAAAIVAALAGYITYRIGEPWVWPAAAAIPVALAIFAHEVSK